MAKIGIMSMQRIVNYGSFLQAYGLKSILEELGHDVQFVDYHVGKSLIQSNTKQKKILLTKFCKVLEVFKYDAPLKHKIQFIFYKKNFSKKYNSILGLTKKPNYLPKLDTLIIGSDEVFNCVQKNPNVGYSLELFGKDNRSNQVITYAASFGNTTIDKLRKFNKDMEVGSLLKEMKCISVRDENSGKIVKKLTNKEVNYNLDPVLAYDYITKCQLIPKLNIKEKYLIVYAYSGRISKEESKWISYYAKNKGLKVYAIGGVQSCADKFIDCSPFEVLSYFKNAEEVITDTFHGTIFSVITKSEFTTLVRKSIGDAYGNEEKLLDLLRRLELENRATFDIERVEYIRKKLIDYKRVDEILKKERNNAKVYLKKYTC